MKLPLLEPSKRETEELPFHPAVSPSRLLKSRLRFDEGVSRCSEDQRIRKNDGLSSHFSHVDVSQNKGHHVAQHSFTIGSTNMVIKV